MALSIRVARGRAVSRLHTAPISVQQRSGIVWPFKVKETCHCFGVFGEAVQTGMDH